MRHESVWLATSSAPARPPLAGAVDVDLVVVGGGITGLTTALLAQRDGASVAVVEAAAVGSGTTGHTTGKVTSQHSTIYTTLLDAHGEEKARMYAEANQHGVELVCRLVDELGADCELRRAPAYVYAGEEASRETVEREAEVAARLGLPASLVSDTELPYPVAAAVRFDDQAHFHAHRYVTALADAVVASGGSVFERSRVVSIDDDRDGVEVHTEGGRITARQVVVATLLPITDIGGYFAKARPTRSYGIAARLRTPAFEGMYISVESPTRSLRPWPGGGDGGVILVGNGHETGKVEDTTGFPDDLARWLRDTFEVESVDHWWSAQDYTSVDELPYVGRSPRTSRTYVATGFRKWGLSNGTAAATILADLLAGRDNPWHPAFDSTRIGDADTVASLIKENLHVGQRWVRDHLVRLTSADVADLAPGQAGLVDVRGRPVGAYRDPDGVVHAVSIVCSHMHCNVSWNAAETSWDCGCHGSRFDVHGDVLNGPAVEPLDRIDVDEG